MKDQASPRTLRVPYANNTSLAPSPVEPEGIQDYDDFGFQDQEEDRPTRRFRKPSFPACPTLPCRIS
jgi:hypothetical protein